MTGVSGDALKENHPQLLLQQQRAEASTPAESNPQPTTGRPFKKRQTPTRCFHQDTHKHFQGQVVSTFVGKGVKRGAGLKVIPLHVLLKAASAAFLDKEKELRKAQTMTSIRNRCGFVSNTPPEARTHSSYSSMFSHQAVGAYMYLYCMWYCARLK